MWGILLGLYRENGKEHGNYYLGFRVYRVKGDTRSLDNGSYAMYPYIKEVEVEAGTT